ncbi:murein biosynthesis integral membrane protein MurJ [Cognatishimia activa]|uniref:murein biosynthesis integral membrane protein MurJ n=1 Tax=Cognatishimia activa TaxID=1715691 RepID=UPI00223038D6|nr:murein biosynthesis integral membrane protein MurJ [Cognatishimia activa]UZD90124.1 murein biosynthesis integral membrane protein MurJ [Cognatishimia activa]
MKPIRLIRSFLTVGFWTLASRILGFAREIMILSLIGPGAALDAFVAAFRLPNMFRRFFAEGAFNAAFVPMFSKKYEAGDDPQAFAQDALNGLSLSVLILIAVAMIFMPGFVWLTAEGFYGDPRFDVTVGYGRIVFPYILFMSLAALFSGVLNATGRFAAAAAAPVLLNIFAVAAMTFGYVLGGEVVTWLLWAIPVAGIAQLALVWVAAERAGVTLRIGRPRWTPDMSHMVRVAVPAALASGVMQINLVVGQLVASRTESAVSWLFAADRLYQLPLGVVGIAVGIVLLPELSRRLKAGDDAGARDAYSRAGEFALALTIPCAVAFLAIPLALVSVMYERGATTAEDSQAIAWAVAIYGLGLPAFVLQKLLQPLYFAREDTKSPFRFAVYSMIINAGLAFGLHPVIGWLAPAVATTVAGWAMVAMLALGAREFGEVARFDHRFRASAPRIIVAAILMGAALLSVQWLLSDVLITAGWRYLALLALISAGAVVYFAIGQIIGAFNLRSLLKGGR